MASSVRASPALTGTFTGSEGWLPGPVADGERGLFCAGERGHDKGERYDDRTRDSHEPAPPQW